MQLPSILGPINDYHQDRLGRIDQPPPHEKPAESFKLVYIQCYVHGHYSPGWRLPYDRWKEVVPNFESLISIEQEEVPRNSMQIALFAKQTAGNNSDRPSPPVVMVNREQASTLRPRRILNYPSERTRNAKPDHNYVHLLDEAPRRVPASMDHNNNEDMSLLKTQSHKIVARIGPIPSVVHKLPAILDTGVEPSFLLEDQLGPFLNSQVTPVTTATSFHDDNNKPLHIVVCLK